MSSGPSLLDLTGDRLSKLTLTEAYRVDQLWKLRQSLGKIFDKEKWDRGPLRRTQSYREGAWNGRAQKTNVLKRKAVSVCCARLIFDYEQTKWFGIDKCRSTKKDEEEEEEGLGFTSVQSIESNM